MISSLCCSLLPNATPYYHVGDKVYLDVATVDRLSTRGCERLECGHYKLDLAALQLLSKGTERITRYNWPEVVVFMPSGAVRGNQSPTT
jgi:hypothetical protein